MARTVYLNGAFVPEAEATISVFDRGFLFADAVYEVTCVIGGKLLDYAGHSARLERSLRELSMPMPMTQSELLEVNKELVRLNGLDTGMVYLQISRGSPPDRSRSFVFPDPKTTPQTVVLFTLPMPNLADTPTEGLRVISIPEQRWARRDIKTSQLLYPSMGKMMALAAGVDDAWFVQDGMVNEATASNAYIVKGNKIITRHLGTEILHGVTRASVLQFARENAMTVEERQFTIAEAQAADEAFITAANFFVTPVGEVDGVKLGSGAPGPVSLRLRTTYVEAMLKTGIPAKL